MASIGSIGMADLPGQEQRCHRHNPAVNGARGPTGFGFLEQPGVS